MDEVNYVKVYDDSEEFNIPVDKMPDKTCYLLKFKCLRQYFPKATALFREDGEKKMGLTSTDDEIVIPDLSPKYKARTDGNNF